MIVNNEDALKRLDSPMNLINQLKTGLNKKNDAMSLFGINKKQEVVKIPVTTSFNPFKSEEKTFVVKEQTEPLDPSAATTAPSTLDNILEDNDTQIKLGLAHDNALKLLNASVDMLSIKLDDIKADKLPAVVSAASKVVEGIRKERSEASKNGKDREVHYHFYTPSQRKVSEYEIIDVA